MDMNAGARRSDGKNGVKPSRFETARSAPPQPEPAAHADKPFVPGLSKCERGEGSRGGAEGAEKRGGRRRGQGAPARAI